MELLELKSVWDVVIQETIKANKIDEFVVAKSIKKDSKTVIAKIKRVMYLKFFLGGLTLVVSVLMAIGTFVIPEKFTFLESIFNVTENRIFLSTMIIFIGGMLTANYFAFKGIRLFNSSETNIKTSLEKFIKIMGRTIRLNIYSGAIFNAFAITWIFYAIAFKEELFNWNMKGFIVAIVPIVTFVVFYFWGRYEQKLKFGNYLDQLKDNLKSLEKENN